MSALTKDQQGTLSEVVMNFVRENPMLYDKKSPDYKDSEKRRMKWKECKDNVNRSLNYGIKKGMLLIVVFRAEVFDRIVVS